MRTFSTKLSRPTTVSKLVLSLALLGALAGFVFYAVTQSASDQIFLDSFERTISNGLGAASEEERDYTLVGPPTDFAVDRGAATIVSATAKAERGAVLSSRSWLDQDVRFRVKTDKLAAGTSQAVHLWLRYKRTLFYRVALTFERDHAVALQIMKVGARDSTLAPQTTVPGLIHDTNSYIWVRAQAQGANPTTLRARAWARTGGEPEAWTVTGTDSEPALQESLPIGFLISGSQNAPVAFTVDDLLVNG